MNELKLRDGSDDGLRWWWCSLELIILYLLEWKIQNLLMLKDFTITSNCISSKNKMILLLLVNIFKLINWSINIKIKVYNN